jgi:hypothetical protein
MAAGASNHVWDVEETVALLDERAQIAAYAGVKFSS